MYFIESDLKFLGQCGKEIKKTKVVENSLNPGALHFLRLYVRDLKLVSNTQLTVVDYIAYGLNHDIPKFYIHRILRP